MQWLVKTTSQAPRITPTWKILPKVERSPLRTRLDTTRSSPRRSATPPPKARPARPASPVQAPSEPSSSRTQPSAPSEPTAEQRTGAQPPIPPYAPSSREEPPIMVQPKAPAPALSTAGPLPLSARLGLSVEGASKGPITKLSQGSFGGQELLPHVVGQPDSDQSRPSAALGGPSLGSSSQELLAPVAASSLADRLGIARQGNGKRPRDGSSPASIAAPPARPSLLDRMSSREDLHSAKKPRTSNESLEKLSLHQRMSKGRDGLPQTPAVSGSAPIDAAPTPDKSMSIRNSATIKANPPRPAPGLSIFGRGADQATPSPGTGLSIKAAAASTTAPSTKGVDDEPVRRKGRGFTREEGSDWTRDLVLQQIAPDSRSPPGSAAQRQAWNPRKVSGQNGQANGNGSGRDNGRGPAKPPASLQSRIS
jgi:hypothetical protein